jgi:hypothetical protein
MRDPDIVVLSRFPEIFAGFRECVDRDAPASMKHVIWDGFKWTGPIPHNIGHGKGWIESWVDESFIEKPFKISRNANIGFATLLEGRDLLYAGDDTRIIEPNTIKRLQELAYSDSAIGILSPRINGYAQAVQMNPINSPITWTPFVAFIFTYIKREVIEQVGYLDELFEGYGWEDLDFCYRVRKAGFKIGVARNVTVNHGVDGFDYGSTFRRVKTEEQMGQENLANQKRFAEKWGLPNDTGAILRAIQDV